MNTFWNGFEKQAGKMKELWGTLKGSYGPVAGVAAAGAGIVGYDKYKSHKRHKAMKDHGDKLNTHLNSMRPNKKRSLERKAYQMYEDDRAAGRGQYNYDVHKNRMVTESMNAR